MKSDSRKTKAVTMSIVLAGVAFALPPALAADAGTTDKAGSTPVDRDFARLDANHDGFLSRSEVRGIRGYGTAFAEADENHDGRLSQDEFIKAEAIYTREQAASYVDDTLLTTKVKAALMKELKLDSADVSVKTEGGQVLLAGFVDNTRQRDQALRTAGKVSGVVAVRNGLVVR